MSDTTPSLSDIVGALERALRTEPVPGLVSVYVFGSHAAGRPHRESDIDLGVLLDRRVHPSKEARFRERVRFSAWAVGVLHRNAVDVVVLNDAPPHLGRHIVTSGCRVVSLDAEADHAYLRDVQLQAADLTPFLDRMRRIKLDALAR